MLCQQAYMHEMSMSLATEIKSEIRGVINRVEDVLSSESADESGSVSAPQPYVSPVFVPAINTPVFDLGCCQQSMMVQSSPLAPLHRTLSSPCTSSYFQVIHSQVFIAKFWLCRGSCEILCMLYYFGLKTHDSISIHSQKSWRFKKKIRFNFTKWSR